MKILAKSALRDGQPESRKSLPVDGIEIIFLGGEVERRKETIEKLIALTDNFPILGVEAPCEEQGLVISPLAENKGIAAASRDYLSICVEIINEAHQRTRKEMYFQYQHSFEPFNQDGKPARYYHQKMIQQLATFHHGLEKNSDIPLHVENGTPIGIRASQPAYVPVTARLHDFVQAALPIALDITHLAITLYSWSQAERSRGGLYRIPTPSGALYIEMKESEAQIGQRIRESSSIQESITLEVIRQIYQCGPFIHSLQFANAKRGVGTDDHDEGYAGTDGLLDIPRIFQEAIIPLNIPYVIPEYTERDYNNPTNQQQAIEMVRALMEQKDKSIEK